MKKIKELLITILTLGSFIFSYSYNALSFAKANISKETTSTIANINKNVLHEEESEIIKLSSFDPRNELTPIKDQGDTNLCWAYSAINASEASILKQHLGNKDTLNLNPKALAYRTFARNVDPLQNNNNYYKDTSNWLTASGRIDQTPSILSMWQGPVSGDKPAIDVYENSLYRLESANLIYSNLDGEDRILEIKKAIAKYGAVTASCYYNGGQNQYYNDNAVTNGIAHAITLIGWDDNIDKNLFKPGNVKRNGGWLIKNSYNDNPYFYLTYDSKISSTTSWTFTYNDKASYDYNYYYDNNDTDMGIFKRTKYANVYQAKKGTNGNDEYIEAINVGFYGNDTDVTIKIYTDLPGWGQTSIEKGTLKATKIQRFKYGGYQTIKLDTPIKVSLNSYFSIVCEVKNESNNAYISVVLSDTKKPSFISTYDGYDYINNGGAIARIKAYTKCKTNEHSHDYNEPTYTWNEDNNKVTAKRICKDDITHIEEETVNTFVTITKNSTCIEKGNKRITTEPFKNKAFITQYKDIELPLSDHTYTDWIEEIKPTIDNEGIKGHKDCSICHKHFDKDNNEIIDLSIPKLIKTYTVTIINGTGSANNVKKGTSITISPYTPEEGMKFIHWKDKNNNIISTLENYTFIVEDNIYLIAVYEPIKIEDNEPDTDNKEKDNKSNNKIIRNIVISISSITIGGFIIFIIIKKIIFKK